MIVALPLGSDGGFSPHFGAAAKVALFTVDMAQRRIVQATTVLPPVPEPCGWADWLGTQGVSVFLAGGMGRGAHDRMISAGIEVIAGVPADLPESLVQAWIGRTLKTGPNGCGGGHDHHPHGDQTVGHCCGTP